MTSGFHLTRTCLVNVCSFPSPSRSIHFGDVSEVIRGERAGNASHFRLDHVTRNVLAAQQNEGFSYTL